MGYDRGGDEKKESLEGQDQKWGPQSYTLFIFIYILGLWHNKSLKTTDLYKEK